MGLLGIEAFFILSFLKARLHPLCPSLSPKELISQLLINREAAKKPLETILKGPEKFIEVRRPTT